MAYEQSRKDYWRMHSELNKFTLAAQPNPSHTIAAFLSNLHSSSDASEVSEKVKEGGDSESGKLLAVMTQNIDGLYQRAGLRQDQVVELHGTTRRVRCMSCKEVYDPEEVINKMLKDTQSKREAAKADSEKEGREISERELEDIWAVPYCPIEGISLFLFLFLASFSLSLTFALSLSLCLSLSSFSPSLSLAPIFIQSLPI